MKGSVITEILEKANNCLNLKIAQEKGNKNQHHNFIIKDAKNVQNYTVYNQCRIYTVIPPMI